MSTSFEHKAAHPVFRIRDAGARLVLVRDAHSEPVMYALSQFLDDLIHGDDGSGIMFHYHEFVYSLLQLDVAPVTGDRWKDYVLHLALERDHAFARGAMQGTQDDVLLRAMGHELQSLQVLFSFSDTLAQDWAQELCHVDASTWTPWAPLSSAQDTFSLLTPMRTALLQAEDWGILASPLWHFYQKNGCGMLLESNVFCYEDEALSPLPPRATRLHELSGHEQESEALRENCRALVCGHGARHVLLVGEAGTGKTAMIRALPQEFPLRLVEFSPAQLTDLPRVLHMLRMMPGKCILLMQGMRQEDLAVLEARLPTPKTFFIAATMDQSETPPAERFGLLLKVENPAAV